MEGSYGIQRLKRKFKQNKGDDKTVLTVFFRKKSKENRGGDKQCTQCSLEGNLSKTKVMINSVDNVLVSRSGVWMCSPCKGDVSGNFNHYVCVG